jgi:dethiobiotin synthetase
MKSYFITGIGTDVGKTVVSTILTESLEADYWKPIQSGDLDYGDRDRVKALIKNTKTTFHPETYRLNTPASPHYSAEIDGIRIDLNNINIPDTHKNLIIEGAGGIFVPLNEQETVLDLIKKLDIPVILVSRNYLGSINHTMLSINALKQNNIEIAGIIFNGEPNAATEKWILDNSGLKCLANIGLAENALDYNFIDKNVKKYKDIFLKELL